MRRSLVLLGQIVALMMIPVMLVSIWLHVQVLDNDRYTESMRDLGADTSFRMAFGDQVTRLLIAEIGKLDISVIQSYVDKLGGIETVYATIESGVNSLVQSPGFVGYWVQINQLTHQQVVDFVRGESSVLTSEDHRGISLNLETIATWLDPFTNDAASAVLALAMADGATQIQIAQSRSFPPIEWVARHSREVAVGATVLFAVFQVLAIAFAENRKRASTIAAIGVATVAAATVVLVKTIVSGHLGRIRDTQGRALAHEYIDAILSDLMTLASALAVTGFLAGAVMIALPFVRRQGSPRLVGAGS